MGSFPETESEKLVILTADQNPMLNRRDELLLWTPKKAPLLEKHPDNQVAGYNQVGG